MSNEAVEQAITATGRESVANLAGELVIVLVPRGDEPLQRRRLGARLHMQFLIDRVQVGAHGAQADAELIRDFLVEKSLRQMIQHLVKSNPTPAYVQRVAAAFTAIIRSSVAT